jgi:folate-binding protein YgfZ
MTFWAAYPRDVVRVSGADAVTYLQSQLSQDLRPLAVDASAWTFLLEPTGKVVVLDRVWRQADDVFVLDTDAGFGETLVARINRFKIRVTVDVEPLDWTCIAVRGATSAAGGLASWGDGVDLLGPDVAPPEGVAAGTAADLDAARIEAVWPAMGHEIVPGQTIPAETGVVDLAVSFTKGCYPGQELVERMDSRSAAAPRTVRPVDVPAGSHPGDPYVVDGTEVGRLTSVAGRRALALVRRSAPSA